MVYDPNTIDDEYTALRDRLVNRISGLTNFARTSFNNIWTRAFSAQLSEHSKATTAVQLSGWSDYSGKELTQEDLNRLGIMDVSPEEINKYIDEDDLNELGKIVGVTRDPGSKATGLKDRIEDESHTYDTNTVKYALDEQPIDNLNEDGDYTITGTLNNSTGHEFTEGTDYQIIDDNGDNLDDTVEWQIGGDNPDDNTEFYVDYDEVGSREIVTVSSDSVVVESGTQFATSGTDDETSRVFLATEDKEPSANATEVHVPIEAEEVGNDYNVGSGQITSLPNPPSGIVSVTNNEATSGGEDEEDNDSLRNRIQTALTRSSDGGTTDGIEGFIEDNTEARDVIVDEFNDGDNNKSSPWDSTPHADVIVEAGETSEVNDAIDSSHPSAVKHFLVRPTIHNVSITADVNGTDIDTASIESELSDYISGRRLEENVYRSKLHQIIHNQDGDVEDVDNLRITIENETHTYDSDNSGGDAPNHPLYKLDKGDQMAPDGDEFGDGITKVTGTLSSSSHTFTEGTDYDEGTVDGSTVDAIDWGVAGDTPDEDTDFDVDYDIEGDLSISTREVVAAGTMNITVV